MRRPTLERFALFEQFFHRFPTGFDKRVRNSMSISWVRLQSPHGIGKPLRIVADVVTQFYAPANGCTRLHNQRAKICSQEPELDSLADELDLLQFAKKSNSLDISFFAADAGNHIESTDCSLGHLNETLRGDCGTSFGHTFRSMRNPYCNTDGGYCTNCLYPRCRSGGGEYVHDIPNSESNVQDAKQGKNCNEAEDGPVRKLEIFEHVWSLLESQNSFERIVAIPADFRGGR